MKNDINIIKRSTDNSNSSTTRSNNTSDLENLLQFDKASDMDSMSMGRLNGTYHISTVMDVLTGIMYNQSNIKK